MFPLNSFNYSDSARAISLHYKQWFERIVLLFIYLFFYYTLFVFRYNCRLLRVPSYVRRYRKRANGRKKSGSLSRRTASVVPGFTVEGQLPHATKPLSSSSSSASGRSEDAPQYGSLPGSDHQGQSQQDDSGPEESPVYILTSAKGGPSYKLRDSR